MNISPKIEKMGFNSWFLENMSEEADGFEIARVVAVHKDRFTVSDGELDILAELVGKMLYNAESPVDIPTVGDWVVTNFYDDRTFSIIHDILPRKSMLKRKTPGKKIEFQLIAANIDVAFIVQSLDENFNLRRLERYLVMVNEGNIKPTVLLSKSDLLPTAEIADKVDQIRKIMPDLIVLPFSNFNESSLKDVKDRLKNRLTFCLLGSSGVGKTTLLNNLIGETVFETKTVREKDNKGRHATTRRQLIVLDNGSMVVDTPGMRELGNFSVQQGLGETFNEIDVLSQNCQFRDCRHLDESGCAVLNAVFEGRLSEKRYQNYIRMSKEAAYNDMSYYEKRMKDRKLGKFYRSVMKHKKNHR
jgi:ribosome biogenesis GTPase